MKGSPVRVRASALKDLLRSHLCFPSGRHMKCSRRTCVSARWPFALFRLIGRSAVALGRRTSATSKRSANGTITRQSAPAETRAIRTAKRAGARWRTARRRALSLGAERSSAMRPHRASARRPSRKPSARRWDYRARVDEKSGVGRIERQQSQPLRWRRSLADHTMDLVDRHRIPRECDQAPGGTGRRVGRRVAAGLELNGNVEGLRRAIPRLSAEPPEFGGDLGELVRVLEADGEEALVPDRAAKWPGLAVEPRYPDRHAWALDGPWQEPH